MKTVHLLLAAITFGALTLGLGAAGDPSRKPSQQEAQGQQGRGSQAGRPHSLLNNNGHVPEKSTQTGSLHIPPKSTLATALHPSASKKTATAANQGLMMNKAAHHDAPLAKLPIGSGNAPARAEVVHARSTATATVGGLAASTTKKSAAVLDGAAMKRKPW
jgi:hypothetical protein